MVAILEFVEFIILRLLDLAVWAVIAYAILSWLIAFNVVNTRNQAIWRISRFLDSLVRPILRPIQRLLPSLGGMDFSPIVFFLLVEGAQRFLIPAFFGWVIGLVGGVDNVI
jgi:YggT family protein